MRYVIRPHGIQKTPRLLAKALGAETTRRWPNYLAESGKMKPSWLKDFFLVYPETYCLEEGSTGIQELLPYNLVRRFAATTKPEQRRLLRLANLPVPSFAATTHQAKDLPPGKYVVRPLRHSQGRDYRVTDDPKDFREMHEYISTLFPKTHEYRVIFCLGAPIITLLKRVPPDLSPEAPWNHANGSTFVTVTQEENNRLRHTSAVEALAGYAVVKHAHLVAADIMLDADKNYVIAELNFCPALTIPSNLEKVAKHVADNR
jgi:hypothetical protein